MANESIQIRRTTTAPAEQIIGGGPRATVPLGPYSTPIQPQPRMPSINEAAEDPPPCAAASSVGAMPIGRIAEQPAGQTFPPSELMRPEAVEQIMDAFCLGPDGRTLWSPSADQLEEMMKKGPKTALRMQDTPEAEMQQALKLSREGHANTRNK